jgi:hypothetical protein
MKLTDPNGNLVIGAIVGGISGGVSGVLGAYLQHGSAYDMFVAGVLGATGGSLIGLFDPTEIGSIALWSGIAGIEGDLIGQALAHLNNGTGGCIDWGEALGAGIAGVAGGGLGGWATLTARNAIILEGIETQADAEWVSNMIGSTISSIASALGGYEGQGTLNSPNNVENSAQSNQVVGGHRLIIVIHPLHGSSP